MPPLSSLLSLSVVSGRVVRHQGAAALFVEFEADALPSPGALLRDPDTGALVEVTSPDNPTEVRAVTRSGPRPEVGVCLDHAEATPDAHVDRAHIAPGDLTLLHASTPGETHTNSPRPLRSGHPGLDLLAPCLSGGAAAWRGDDMGRLRALAHTLTPTLLDHLGPNAQGLWVGAKPPPEPLDAHWTLIAPQRSTAPGEAAIALRSASHWAARRGHPLLIVWDDPEAVLGAWMSTDVALVGPAAGTLAMRHATAQLTALLTSSEAPRAVLGLLPAPHVGRHLPGTIDLGIERLFSVLAEFEGDTLQLRDAVGVESLPEALLGKKHLQVVRAVQDVLGVALEVGDHAAIFGESELMDAQREILAVASGLEAWLGTPPVKAVGWDEVVDRCVALIQGSY